MFPEGLREIPAASSGPILTLFGDGASGASIPTSLLFAPSQSAKAFKEKRPISGYAVLGKYGIVLISGDTTYSDGTAVVRLQRADTTEQHPLAGVAWHLMYHDTATRELRVAVVGFGEHPVRSICAVNNLGAGPLWNTMTTLFATALENSKELSDRFGEGFVLRMNEPEVRDAVLSKVADGGTTRDLYKLLRKFDSCSGIAVCVKSLFLNDPKYPEPKQIEEDDRALTTAEPNLPALDPAESNQLTNDAGRLGKSESSGHSSEDSGGAPSPPLRRGTESPPEPSGHGRSAPSPLESPTGHGKEKDLTTVHDPPKGPHPPPGLGGLHPDGHPHGKQLMLQNRHEKGKP
jgi:hypothetical protein